MKVTRVKSLPAFQLELAFDNAESGIVDLKSLVGRGVFAAWERPGVFEQVAISDCGAVEWPGGIDLCPDALYLQMTGKRAEEIFPALKNRFSHA
jgi:Protein of unknown function (DUF2442)